MNTLKLLLREFWVPLALAIGWTLYVHFAGPPLGSLKAIVTTFGPAFFLASWATGQFIRVRRQSHVESNLRTIQSRLESLLTQIETRTSDLLAQITGGDSFCYVQLFDIQQNTAHILAVNTSAHPVFNGSGNMADLECLERAFASKGAIHPTTCYNTLHVPNLAPGKAGEIGQLSLGEGIVRRFNIFWSARNGDWIQLLRLAKVNGIWRSATRVTRGTTVLHEDLQPDFPRDALGSDWKDAKATPPAEVPP
jgi:hypothetical protein